MDAVSQISEEQKSEQQPNCMPKSKADHEALKVPITSVDPVFIHDLAKITYHILLYITQQKLHITYHISLYTF